MPKKTVVEINCERCEGLEYVDPELAPKTPDLKASLGFAQDDGKPMEATFEVLCSSCRSSVKNLFEQMTKKIRRGRKAGDEAPAATGS